MAKKKNKKKQKVSTIVGPGVPQYQEGDAPIDLGMLDEITLSDFDPNYANKLYGANDLKLVPSFFGEDKYLDKFGREIPLENVIGIPQTGIAPTFGGKINPKDLVKMVKNVPKYAKKLIKTAKGTNKTILKEPISEYSKMNLPKGIRNVKSKQLPAVVDQPSTSNIKNIAETIKNSKIGKAAKSTYNYFPDYITKKMLAQGYTPKQIETGMNMLKGTSVVGGVTNAVMSGSSGDEDRSDRNENQTFYTDEFGDKYKIVDGKKVSVEAAGGMYSKALKYMGGGVQQLPGGVMQPIGGGAVEFIGNEHDEAGMGSDSGILLDPQTEVEDGETMTQVAGHGGMKDYFFSNKLMAGGMTFADKHKEMVKEGAGQEQVNYLAKMQEAVAGRDPGVIKANYGGLRKRFVNGGENDGLTLDSNFKLNPLQLEYFKLLESQDERYPASGPLTEEQSNSQLAEDHDGDGLPNYADPEYRNLNDQGQAIANIQAAKKNQKEQPKTTVDKQDLKNYEAYGSTYDKVEKAMIDSGYQVGKRAEDQGDKGIAGMQNQLGKSGVYGEASMNTEEGRKDFFNRNKTLMSEMGVTSWEDWNPAEMTDEFQRTFNSKLNDRWDNDEQFRNEMEAKGISKDDYMSTGFGGEGASAQDGLFGEYTFSRTSEDFMNDPAAEDLEVEEDPVEIEEIQVDPEQTDPATTDPTTKDKKSGFDLTTAAQFLPSMLALGDKPDYMAEADPVVANAVVASEVGKVNLDRVDYTDQKSRLQNQVNAMTYNPNRQMSASEKAMMLTRFNDEQSKITSAENTANTQIGNQEANTNAAIAKDNAARAQAASTTNVGNQLIADRVNTQNKMYVDEFNRGADAATFDRKLNAFQTMATNLGTLKGDQLRYKADKNIAKANLAGTVGPDGKTIYDRKAIEDMFARYGGIRKNKD